METPEYVALSELCDATRNLAQAFALNQVRANRITQGLAEQRRFIVRRYNSAFKPRSRNCKITNIF
jgi:hypothetical protein